MVPSEGVQLPAPPGLASWQHFGSFWGDGRSSGASAAPVVDLVRQRELRGAGERTSALECLWERLALGS